jgi:hypothetical protein
MLLAILLLAADITPQSIPEPQPIAKQEVIICIKTPRQWACIPAPPIVCTSSIDDKGHVSASPCLAPNTGNIPEVFVIPEGDRK